MTESIKVNLITGRSLAQGKTKEFGKLSEEYLNNVAICEFNPDDINKVGISPGQNVKIVTNFGHVIVKAIEAKQPLESGMVFMPYGPWAEFVINPETHGTGMPSYKGIEATIEPAQNEKVLTIEEIVKILLSK
jgi:formylmethanofuran dehydrogenase subunit D